MIHIRYPEHQFKIKEEGGKRYVFDAIRKKWLFLTEEEWVRQNFVQYLVVELKYPATVIALEKEIKLHEIKKRFDVLVYNDQHQPWMLVECKSPLIPLSDAVLQQVLQYNISIPVPYIIITNGANTIGCKRGADYAHWLQELPAWNT